MHSFRTTLGLALAAACGIATLPARADVTLPTILSDNMVIQRGMPIHIWGHADPGEQVVVTLMGDKASAVARPDGQWQAALKPHAAGGPYSLTVTGKNTVTLSNVLIGDLWLCGGQSNMEFTLRRASNATAATAASTDPLLRFFKVRTAKPASPADDVRGAWVVSGPETAGAMSAVGYFFGRDLRKAEGIPIGLISSNVGGTPAQSWTRAAALAASPDLKRRYVDPDSANQAKHDAAIAAYTMALAAAKAAGTKEPTRPFGFWPSSVLYNGMIAPLVRLPIEGVLWYQGESNSHDPEGYRALLPTMITDWRAQWNEPALPFLIVQLAPFGSHEGGDTAWAKTREAQTETARALPHAGIAVITDVGLQDNIHPTNKEPVGDRLALLARKQVYGEKALVAEGPTYRAMRVMGSKIRVTFDNVGDGLTIRGGQASAVPVPADRLVGFTVAGADGKFVPAEAKIVGKDTVEISAAQVVQPSAARYGFVNFPVVNLWNKNGLPANPFRTDRAQ